jgi:formate dehydrogenase major subunit
VFAEMAAVMPSLANITWERVDRENSVTYPASAPDRPGADIVFADGFPTESTRGRMVPADIIPPDEMPDDEFPMILTTGTQLEHWHTGAMSRRSRVLDAIEPEAVAAVNPDDLTGIGMEPGDRIRIMTRRGVIEMTARADPDVPRGVVFIAFCYVEAAANLLTNAALDPVGKIPDFKFCAVRVEKAEHTAAAE